jgi:hypothetical protein
VDFVKFVRSVEGKPVTRFAEGGRGGVRVAALFGASRVEGRVVYDTAAVSAITAEEWERFGKIYARNIVDGHLVECTREEYDAYRAAQSASAGGVS